jgi:hypothetical protein
VKKTGFTRIIFTVLLITLVFFPVVIASGETNQSGAVLSGVSDQEYLRGRTITTPESVGDSPEMKTAGSSTSVVKMALSGSEATPLVTTGIEWQALMGGYYGDILYDVKETTDGGYIAAGATAS